MSRKSTRAKSSTVSEQSHGKQPLPCKKAAWTLELVKKEEKQPACVIFICGAADRSGRGKCCSSSCCCWGTWGTVFRSPMCTQNGCIQRKLFFKMGASRENFSSKSVYPEKLKLKLSMNSEANAADQKGSLSCFFIPPLRRQKKSGKEALSFPCGNQEMRGGAHMGE